MLLLFLMLLMLVLFLYYFFTVLLFSSGTFFSLSRRVSLSACNVSCYFYAYGWEGVFFLGWRIRKTCQMGKIAEDPGCCIFLLVFFGDYEE
jgi:hypothetical protein